MIHFKSYQAQSNLIYKMKYYIVIINKLKKIILHLILMLANSKNFKIIKSKTKYFKPNKIWLLRNKI
jgi:hypothetical protein